MNSPLGRKLKRNMPDVKNKKVVVEFHKNEELIAN